MHTSLKEIVSFSGQPPPVSASPNSTLSKFRPSKRSRLRKRTVSETILRRLRRIFSRSSYDSTSGPSKSLATIRKPPKGKSVTFNRVSTASPIVFSGVNAQKYENQRGNVRNSEIFVIDA